MWRGACLIYLGPHGHLLKLFLFGFGDGERYEHLSKYIYSSACTHVPPADLYPRSRNTWTWTHRTEKDTETRDGQDEDGVHGVAYDKRYSGAARRAAFIPLHHLPRSPRPPASRWTRRKRCYVTMWAYLWELVYFEVVGECFSAPGLSEL